MPRTRDRESSLYLRASADAAVYEKLADASEKPGSVVLAEQDALRRAAPPAGVEWLPGP
jgi:hypothetical protein